ncbi:MAG: gliding motility-associated C-terminal domain-containing protein [Bacteroidota bacterium]|nr:gliding motility-associated C-terminal domain-containing protein [Bacteroidota bacterium]
MKRSLIILCLLACFLNQGNAQVPDTIVLLNVSVSPEGYTSFNWIPSDSINVAGYIIYRWVPPVGTTEPVDTILDRTAINYTWLSQLGLMQSWSYSISAWDSTLNRESALSMPPHTSIFLKTELDSCTGSANLLWNNYVGWGNSLFSYIIYRNEEAIDTITPGDTTYSDPGIIAHESYVYYIKALHEAGRISTSNNSDTILVDMNAPPEYINALGTIFTDELTLELNFKIDPASELHKYYLLRSENITGAYDTINRLNIYDSVQTITDIIPEQKPYYYKLVSMNHCLQIARSSNIASTISLSTSNNNFLNRLEWNEYLNWKNGVEGYEVYRQIDEETPISIAVLTTETTSYIDDVEDEAHIGNSGKYCYHVKAREESGLYSISNISCEYPEPMIYMPNAFTPDGDGLNDTFWPVLTFLPDKYIFIIKNRWGNTLFETHDPFATWDGTFSGDPVLEGVYVYYVRAVSPDGKLIERTGQVAVLYN